MKKSLFMLLAAGFLLTGCVVMTLPGVSPLKEKTIGGSGRDKILLINISGVIRDRKEKNLLGSDTSRTLTARIREELDMAREDKRVKALILRINTPGGHVTTSDTIYHEIKSFKKDTGVPVVAEFMDMAASGGYYIGVAADRIVAQPTTITGSIGVVAYNVDATGLLDKIGINERTIKSGDKKDLGSPLRGMTVEEHEILQSIINELYERFLGVVLENREELIGRDRLMEISDGRVYTASQALELRLIDRVGYMDDAVSYARELAGIDEATLVTYSESDSYRKNFYSSSGAPPVTPSVVNLVNINTSFMNEAAGPRFMYIWMP
ncbi:MAG: signal peptide peptidase SppA [Thermodesulfobacteriota bacterium]